MTEKGKVVLQLTQVTPAILRGLSLPQAKPPNCGLGASLPISLEGDPWGPLQSRARDGVVDPVAPPCPPGGSSLQEIVFLLGSN